MYYVNYIPQMLWRTAVGQRVLRLFMLTLTFLALSRNAEGQSGPYFIGRVLVCVVAIGHSSTMSP